MPVLPIGLILGAISAASQVKSLFSRPSMPQVPQGQAGATPFQKDDRAKMALHAARQFVPNIQELTGGSLSPDYHADAAATGTGFGDQRSSAMRAALERFGVTMPGEDSSGAPTGAQYNDFRGYSPFARASMAAGGLRQDGQQQPLSIFARASMEAQRRRSGGSSTFNGGIG